jgi:hypothetical protein
MATGDTGRRVGPGNGRQRTVRHGLNTRYMKGSVYTKVTGQQKMNSRWTNNSRDGKWANKQGGEFVGFHPEGQIPGGQLYLLP